MSIVFKMFFAKYLTKEGLSTISVSYAFYLLFSRKTSLPLCFNKFVNCYVWRFKRICAIINFKLHLIMCNYCVHISVKEMFDHNEHFKF